MGRKARVRGNYNRPPYVVRILFVYCPVKLENPGLLLEKNDGIVKSVLPVYQARHPFSVTRKENRDEGLSQDFLPVRLALHLSRTSACSKPRRNTQI